MPIGFEDATAQDISGDPPPTRPMNQTQLQGAVKARVNQTRLPAGNSGAPPAQTPESKSGQTQEQISKESKQPDAAGQPPPGVEGALALGGALDKTYEAAKQQTDQILSFNPAHGQDWWKGALESPIESYYIGKHLFNAYYGAFLDANAFNASIHDIWHQDNAVSWLLKNVVAPHASEQQAESVLTPSLQMGANPENVVMGGGTRGLALVAQFLLPAAANAIFSDQHTPSDLAWAVLPAVVFGGRLPAPVEQKLGEIAPGVGKVVDNLIASKLAQNANKTGLQDRNQLIKDLLANGALPAKADVMAKGWASTMEGMSNDAKSRLESALRSRYSTLDPEKVIPALVRDGASTRLLQNTWTKLFKMPYDLLRVAPEEAALVDPRSRFVFMTDAKTQKIARDGWQWTAHMIQQAHLGTAGHDADPVVSRFRSLLGLQSTDRLVFNQWTDHLRQVAGAHAKDPLQLDDLVKALESSGPEQEKAYLSLSTEMQYVRDSMRLVAAAIGKAGEEEGVITGRVANYWPRVGLLVKDGKGTLRPMRGTAPLTREPLVHRQLSVTTVDMLTESRMQVEQAYKTVKDANAAVQRQRGYVTEGILNGTPWHEMASETGAGIPDSDVQQIMAMQTLAAIDPEVARIQAEAYAAELLPEFSTDPFDGLSRLGSQLRAITSRKAITDLLNTQGKDGKRIAIEAPTNDRAADLARKQGYTSISIPGFRHVWVNAQYGKLLEEAVRVAKLPGGLEKMAELEHQAVTMIMFSPRIHGLNMAGRLGIAFATHPMEVSRWFAEGLLQKGGLSQLGIGGTAKIGPEEYRMIPRRYGIVPPNPDIGKYAGGFADKYIAQIGDLFGDTETSRPPILSDLSGGTDAMRGSSTLQGLGSVAGKARDLLWGKQPELWSWISDFGNMMWWIEYAAARRGGLIAKGLEHEEAARYATARANSWMGHVAPNDWNPNVQAALKTAFFAPNWWRTWAEILTGYYRNQGFGWSANTIKYVVENEVKTALAAVMFQQLSANALNLAFSGHTIYQNDPGSWGKIEITNPAVLEMLNATVLKGHEVDAKTGRDAKGAKLTWENPLARQMVDTEQAMGLLTSAHNWSPEAMQQGFSSFAAARTSPVMQSLAALANIDLYRSVSSDGVRYVDPNHDSAFGSPLADILTAAGDLTPFAQIPQNIQQQIMQGNVQDLKGPFGLPIPKAVVDAFNPQSVASDLGKSMLVGLTGVNPPYMRSPRGEGVSPTDDQYKTVRELNTTYQQQMTALSTASLSGQMAPYQWLAAYQQLSLQHGAQMQALFHHAPEYEYGPLALTNSWEGLYQQATDQNGVLDSDKLRALQQQWQQQHSPADYAAVQSELRANDQKYPMLALYHKTQDAYHSWQSDWCKANGVDLATLQSDLAGWSSVYRDRTASAQWVRDHPEITQFENAKKTEFESGQSTYGMAGLMYALFFNPTLADRILLTSGETAQQVEQQAQGAA